MRHAICHHILAAQQSRRRNRNASRLTTSVSTSWWTWLPNAQQEQRQRSHTNASPGLENAVLSIPPPPYVVYIYAYGLFKTNKQTNPIFEAGTSASPWARGYIYMHASLRLFVCITIGSLALVRILTWQLHTQPPPAPSSHKLLRRCWYEWQEPDKEGGSRVLKLHWSSLRRRILQPMLLLHSSNPEASWNKNRRLKSHLPILSVYEIFI